MKKQIKGQFTINVTVNTWAVCESAATHICVEKTLATLPAEIRDLVHRFIERHTHRFLRDMMFEWLRSSKGPLSDRACMEWLQLFLEHMPIGSGSVEDALEDKLLPKSANPAITTWIYAWVVDSMAEWLRDWLKRSEAREAARTSTAKIKQAVQLLQGEGYEVIRPYSGN